MKIIALKSGLSITLMIILLVLALMTKDVINRQLFAGLSLIAGTLFFHNLSSKNQVNNE